MTDTPDVKVTLAVAVVACGLVLAGCGSGGDDSAPTGPVSVSLRVESDGNTADITYGAGGSQSQATGASVPWIQTVTVDAQTAKAASALTIVAQADGAASYVSCEVVVGTKTISKNRSTGPYSVVTC